MNYNYYTSDELYHYGVKGMKWGVRKAKYVTVSKLGSAAKKILSSDSYIKKDGYSKTKQPSYIKKDGYQKRKTPLLVDGTRSVKNNRPQFKISSKTVKRADKAQQKLAKTKMKDLQKQYGALEDKLTYGKKADTRMNSQVLKEMERIENMMKTPTVKEQIKKRRGNI